MSASPSAKRQKSSKDVPYELIYWPGVPGRGEHIRLALEEAGVDYVDKAVTDPKALLSELQALIKPETLGEGANPPICAPPCLRHGDLLLNQTPNILFYLGQRLGLAPSLSPSSDADEADGAYHVNELALTALDGLSNEAHETHHPIATGKFYEDQKEEAKKRSKDYTANRIPKFLGYFQRVLQSDSSGDGPWLHGGKLTYADLVLFQCIDGVTHAFPKAMAKLKESGDYDKVFELYRAVKERPKIKAYLESPRRQAYGMGIYRHYPELEEDE